MAWIVGGEGVAILVAVSSPCSLQHMSCTWGRRTLEASVSWPLGSSEVDMTQAGCADSCRTQRVIDRDVKPDIGRQKGRWEVKKKKKKTTRHRR